MPKLTNSSPNLQKQLPLPQQEKMSQENEDDSTSEIQITNVCSLSSVLNMYLPHDEKVVKTVPTRGNKTNSLTSYGTPTTDDSL